MEHVQNTFMRHVGEAENNTATQELKESDSQARGEGRLGKPEGQPGKT